MKTILITGGDGFLGGFMVEQFVAHGYKVRIFTDIPQSETQETDAEKIERVCGDICDQQALIDAAKGCDGIIHLVALKAVQDSFEAKERYYQVNVGGTKNVLEAALLNGVKKVIITSSSEVYGQPKELPIKEDHPLEGLSPYALTKIEDEKLAEEYRKKGLNVVVVRPTNIFGPRQSTKAVIPTIITQMVRKEKELKIGLLSPTIDFNYVEDVARAYLMIYESDKTDNETYNIATGISTSIGEIADYVIEKLNPEAVIVCDLEKVRPVSDADKRFRGDSTKLRKATGWTSEVGIFEGIDLTIEYIRNNIDKY